MQLKITLNQMISYIRSLDERLLDTRKYTDEWCTGKINTAYEVIATRRQPFLNEEVLDLNSYIIDGTEKFQVDMDYDVQGYKRIFVTPEGSLAVTFTVRPDNIIDVFLDVGAMDSTDENTLTFQYYYMPTAPTEETYLSADVYHMLRHGMEFAVYEALRDMEKFQWAQQKIEDSAKTVINGLDIDVNNDGWTKGFV